MIRIFVDTHYWVALINPRDQWRKEAIAASRVVGNRQFVTTDEVLTETLNYFSEARKELRVRSVEEVRAILLTQNVEVISSRHEVFLDAIDLYESRPDQGYSLTDCISMKVCLERGISDVLTHDNHFSQEGFSILL